MLEWLRKLWSERRVETRILRDVTSAAEKARIDERWKLIQARLKSNGAVEAHALPRAERRFGASK